MIVDTHLHLIDRTALRYPWLGGVSALDRDWSYADYARDALRAGIAQVLHMEVDVAPEDSEAETGFVAAQAALRGNLLRGAICACRPEDAGFPAFLERQLDNSFVKGFRRVLHVVPNGVSGAPLFRGNLRRLAGTGLTFDIVVRADQLGEAIALADALPDVSFVLDHCGNPDIAGGMENPWRASIAALARRTNVTAKVSGVINKADPDTWTVETLRPYVEHVIESFGWDRVVWGSDWPVCNLGAMGEKGLLAWVAATHAILAGTSIDERSRLLSGNARRLWRLPLNEALSPER